MKMQPLYAVNDVSYCLLTGYRPIVWLDLNPHSIQLLLL